MVDSYAFGSIYAFGRNIRGMSGSGGDRIKTLKNTFEFGEDLIPRTVSEMILETRL